MENGRKISEIPKEELIIGEEIETENGLVLLSDVILDINGNVEGIKTTSVDGTESILKLDEEIRLIKKSFAIGETVEYNDLIGKIFAAEKINDDIYYDIDVMGMNIYHLRQDSLKSVKQTNLELGDMVHRCDSKLIKGRITEIDKDEITVKFPSGVYLKAKIDDAIFFKIQEKE